MSKKFLSVIDRRDETQIKVDEMWERAEKIAKGPRISFWGLVRAIYLILRGTEKRIEL